MRTILLAFCLGAVWSCSATIYRTEQGGVFHESTPALLANGAADLRCPQERLQVRPVRRQEGRHRSWTTWLYLVEGCGSRATYVEDCHPEYAPSDPRAGKGPVKEGQPEWGMVETERTACVFDLITRVELSKDSRASSPAQ